MVYAAPITIDLSDEESDKNSGCLSESDDADEGNQVKKLALQ